MKYERAEPFRPSPEILTDSVRDLIRWSLNGDIDPQDFAECYAELRDQQLQGWIPHMTLQLDSGEAADAGQFTFEDIQFFMGATGIREVVVLTQAAGALSEVAITAQTTFDIQPAAKEVVRSSYATV